MDSAVIRDCWEIVRQAEETLLTEYFLPFPGIEDCLAGFSLSTLPSLPTPIVTAADIHSVKPAFKNLTESRLVSLRRHAFAQTELECVSQWAEKLLRFCELRHRALLERAVKVCKSKTAAQLRLLHLAAFLMDQFAYTKDLRLLNIVLKLADLKWLLDEANLKRGLRATDGAAAAAILQFRMVLTTDYAMQQLHQGARI